MLLQKQNYVQKAKKFKNIFALKTQILYLQHMLRTDEKEEAFGETLSRQ